MRHISKGIMAMIWILGILSFAYGIHEQMPAETQLALPGPDAVKLYDYIAKYKPYDTWELWPGKGRLYSGREPHGALLTTYVNSEAYFSIGKKVQMADGSIIVKENYTSSKKLDALTVMYKIQGYNPEAGDWFWAKYDPYGRVLASGKVQACIGCHGANKGNDFIMTEKLLK